MTSDGDRTALTIDGRERTFTMYVPATQPVALALVLHGNSPDAGGWMMRRWTTFDHQADEWGLAIAYPDGHQGCWADGRGVTTADETGVDDVAFLRAIIDWSADRHGTAPDRTVVAGISNGAFMAHRMALATSEQVAVLAAVAGGLPAALSDQQPSHAVSALLIHGTADRIAPIDGGYSRHRGPNGELRGRTLSLQESAERWRTIDGCGPDHKFASRTEASDGVGGTRVAAWTVVGGGHTWPGMPTPPESTEPVTQEFDAAEEICRFAAPLLNAAHVRRI
ncbi:MAG TPA: PHB depolymerase family esterase [Pseudonocardiaceae bacterium]|nr:PHB depolymerase family esterase [Pseudonocardiaceae bacterium]